MKSFSRFTSTMPASGIRAIMVLSAEVEGCIHLEVGQPDFRTPEHILEHDEVREVYLGEQFSL